MTPVAVAEQERLVPRHSKSAMAEALFSLSQTQRRLAHEAKRNALAAQAKGKDSRFLQYRAESDRLWRAAKFYLRWARDELYV